MKLEIKFLQKKSSARRICKFSRNYKEPPTYGLSETLNSTEHSTMCKSLGRKMSRHLGLTNEVQGSGRNNRILKEDLGSM